MEREDSFQDSKHSGLRTVSHATTRIPPRLLSARSDKYMATYPNTAPSLTSDGHCPFVKAEYPIQLVTHLRTLNTGLKTDTGNQLEIVHSC